MKKIFWYCPNTIFSSFKDPLDNPSFRLRCWNIHKRLLNDGYSSNIVAETNLIEDGSIVVLMSFGEVELALAQRIKSTGGILIHDYSENIRGIPILEQTKNLCDKIVCCSTVLGNLEALQYGDKVTIVRDPIEESPVIHNSDFQRDRLQVVWCGMGGNANLVEVLLKPIIEANDMDYIEISNRPNATYTWQQNTWQQNMASCDISICPQDHWNFPAKSNVKVTSSMALGLPVVASPIQSYKEIIMGGEHGFICDTLEDWDFALKTLKSSATRKNIAEICFNRLFPYKPENIYRKWLDVFKKLMEK